MRFVLLDFKEDNSESEYILQYEDLSYCCNNGKLYICMSLSLKVDGFKFLGGWVYVFKFSSILCFQSLINIFLQIVYFMMVFNFEVCMNMYICKNLIGIVICIFI